MRNWENLNGPIGAELNAGSIQLHAAAQLLAMAGKYLLPNQDDDSHTALLWDEDFGGMTTQVIEGQVRVGLQFDQLLLAVLSEDEQQRDEVYFLTGHTPKEGFEWLQLTLSGYGINTDALQMEMHYEIPEEVERFERPSDEVLIMLQKIRDNAEALFSETLSLEGLTSPIYTWPHHFDTATVLPVSADAEGVITAGIYLGLAVPDDMIKDHYFYCYAWQKEGQIDHMNMPAFSNLGQWHGDDHWKGATLSLQRITDRYPDANQFQAVNQFFREAIGAYHQALLASQV